MSASAKLAAVLQGLPVQRRAVIKRVVTCTQAARLVSRAAKGQDVHALAYLQMCGALAIDATTGEALPASAPLRVPAEINWPIFAFGVRGARILAGDASVRDFAAQVGVSPATVSRAENGKELSAQAYLALVAAIGVSPHYYVQAFAAPAPTVVSRETPAETP
ncbi:helix-turn-helix transcriptional regulator [Xanthobacteraceae bacterium Astr-EGSB]|uniref:helix-turn-helix domain-containing protein n=1 Tax=Astrobacterium formosum TaxID=3069710 RepID=UPI0027B1867F|nr:helix-turn-helix transcriptional regulator [Xanthobacteraceae bacterium Astr-EGSB]